jgi:hypothetical protein
MVMVSIMERNQMQEITENTDGFPYIERIYSNKTEALFLFFTLLCFLLMLWRLNNVHFDWLAFIFACFFIFFLFYSINYRMLLIHLTPHFVKLTFGLFTWTIPVDNIQQCRLDEIPLLMKMGGAGIHFMMIRKRYRASFNFLEFPRVVLAFKKKMGPVQDISFSTQKPDQVISLVQRMIGEKPAKSVDLN